MIQYKGELFEEVQLAAIFPDSKTFSDAIPKSDEDVIIKNYQVEKTKADFDLKAFVLEHFTMPEDVASHDDQIDHTSVEGYIESLWDILKHNADKAIANDSLIPIPDDYIIPGGRFREIYYWDSYFTAVGLASVGKYDMIESMVKAFNHLQKTVGLIPNGNRWYYATRSQPPVVAMMVDLLYEKYGLDHIKPYIPMLEREHEIWTTGDKAVKMPNDTELSRYYDKGDWPREESYKEDYHLADGLSEEESKKLFRNLRSGAESGFDFTSRWFADHHDLSTIETTDIIPVDLNGWVYGIEMLLAKYFEEMGEADKANNYRQLAAKRKAAIDEYCWNEEKGFYFDYNFIKGEQTGVYSMAGCTPLFFEMASQAQADKVRKTLEEKLLQPGGFVTTDNATGQQWDWPNGWPPMQWFGVKGLLNYGHKDLAVEVMERWMKAVRTHFAKSGSLKEKYDVCDMEKLAAGGEYGVQEGFGWTNGVVLKFIELLKELG